VGRPLRDLLGRQLILMFSCLFYLIRHLFARRGPPLIPTIVRVASQFLRAAGCTCCDAACGFLCSGAIPQSASAMPFRVWLLHVQRRTLMNTNEIVYEQGAAPPQTEAQRTLPPNSARRQLCSGRNCTGWGSCARTPSMAAPRVEHLHAEHPDTRHPDSR
jgi:hypothetical protein